MNTPDTSNPIPREWMVRHSRRFQDNRFVYPVVSRRSRGLSLGINLNPDKVCNFDCIYCQVDRTAASETRFVATRQLVEELELTIELILSGELFRIAPWDTTPLSLRALRDIAFSGDGEPTTYRNFDRIISLCAETKQRFGLGDVKMVLITNASMFHRPAVERGLEILDANQGEIWAKLEAGTEAYFRRVDRTTIPFQRILDNIASAARIRPLVIQALFMRIDGQPPPEAEIGAFCERLREIVGSQGKLKLVQIYTVARPPAERSVTALTDEEIDRIVERVQSETGLPAAGFYGGSGGN